MSRGSFPREDKLSSGNFRTELNPLRFGITTFPTDYKPSMEHLARAVEEPGQDALEAEARRTFLLNLHYDRDAVLEGHMNEVVAHYAAEHFGLFRPYSKNEIIYDTKL